MAWVKVANLKGPKGKGIANPKIVGDNLVVDLLDGPVVEQAAAIVGNVRGPVGPQGIQGERGPVGLTPNMQMTGKTGDPGSEVTVWRTGTDEQPMFEVMVPRGDQGEVGPQGPVGPMPKLAATARSVPSAQGAGASVVPVEDGYRLDIAVPEGQIGPMPSIIFETPINLANGSQPLVNVNTPRPGEYRVQLGLVQGPPGAASQSIRDDKVSTETAWSSFKTRAEIDRLIDDEVQGAASTWSSERVQQELQGIVDGLPQQLFNDLVKSSDTTWTSSRISQAISEAVANAKPTWSSITNRPTTFPAAPHSHSWGEITGKPSSFLPSSHKHNAADVNAGVLDPARLPAATESVQGAVKVDREALSQSPTAVPSSALVQSLLGQVMTWFDFTLDHADWSVNFAKGAMDSGTRMVSFALRLSAAKTTTWSANRRQIGRIPPSFAPATSFAAQVMLRHSGKWTTEVVEVAENGALYLVNSESIKVDGTTQVNVSMNWVAK